MKNFEPTKLRAGGAGGAEGAEGAREKISSPASPAPPASPASPALLRQGSREQLAVSRLSITIGLVWLLGYLLLATGAATSEFLTLRLLILNSFLTSGYFLVSFWLIICTVRGQSKRLPGISSFAERVLGKYLS